MTMLRSYTAADAFTIGNASCGAIAILLCLEYVDGRHAALVWAAIVLLPFALVLDVLDGYVARLQPSRQSRLGADLDSLADVISFGVAPAVIGYALGLRGGWDMLCLTYFIVCGVSRLARFNVTAADARDDGPVRCSTSRGRRFPPASSSSACWRLRWGRARRRARSGSAASASARRCCTR